MEFRIIDTTRSAPKWWNEAVRQIDPECQVIWGRNIHRDYHVDRWVLERRIPHEITDNWQQRRRASHRQDGWDSLGPKPEWTMVSLIETPSGGYREFSSDVLDWMRRQDAWAKFKTAENFVRAKRKSDAERKKAEDYQAMKDMTYFWRHEGFRFNRHSDGEIHVTNREMTKY